MYITFNMARTAETIPLMIESDANEERKKVEWYACITIVAPVTPELAMNSPQANAHRDKLMALYVLYT
jgi:hypothetical protein